MVNEEGFDIFLVRREQPRRFADTYERMHDEQSMTWVSEAAALPHKSLALGIKFFNAVGKSISGKAAARFYQIDDFINTAMRLDVMAKIPLFGDAQPQ